MAELYREDLRDFVGAWMRARRWKIEPAEWKRMEDNLSKSCLVYVGNLSIYTTEAQIYHFFRTAGGSASSSSRPVKSVIMGLNRQTMTPCGFCFVEFFTHQDAVDAVRYLSGLKLDERVIKVELDYGFEEGRQYGRGKSGGQRRDDFRDYFDYERGDKLDQNNDRPAVNGSKSADNGSAAAPEADVAMTKEPEAEENPRFRERTDSDEEDE